MKREHQEILLAVARSSIASALDGSGDRGTIESGVPAELMEKKASFVTLRLRGRLRGCIGTMEAWRPLVEDVAANARMAAFEDPRFPPLTREAFERVELSISVLSPPEELVFASEEEAFAQIRPGVDGVILQEGSRRGTFLPSVWEELPEKRRFWECLKMKAGLAPDWWSDRMRVFRYTAERVPASESS